MRVSRGRRSRRRRRVVVRRTAAADLRPGGLRRHVRRRDRRRAGAADGQDGGDRRARHPPGRAVQRRAGIHRHRQQGGDRRPVARVLSPRLAAVSTAGDMEVAAPRGHTATRDKGTPAIDGEQRTMWIFEPHVAEQVFEALVREHRIPVHRDEWLDRRTGVTKSGGRITSIRMAERTDLRRTDVHRRNLRGRSHGRGRRRLPRGARGAEHL